MNAPDRFELFVIPEGKRKLVSTVDILHVSFSNLLNVITHRVEMEEDTKIPNAATFKIEREDHTLANMLRM